MRNKVFMLFLIVGTLTLLLTGCDSLFEAPYDVSVAAGLEVKITAGPTGAVPNGAWITFRWTTAGGTGNITGYQYMLDGVDASWSAATLEQYVKYDNVTAAGSRTFHVKATDSAGNTAEATRTFTLSANTDKPVLTITMGLPDGGKIASGRNVGFEWSATDASPYFGVVKEYAYKLGDGAWSAWSDITSVVFTALADGDYTFSVKARDNAGDEGATVTRSFTIKPPSILLIDDYDQGPDDLEYAEWVWWDQVLNGYAWEKYDVADNGDVAPADLTGYTTVIYCVDPDGTWNPWDLFDGGDRTWITDWMDAGGNLITDGGEFIDYAWNAQPGPAADDFISKYMGLEPGTKYDFYDPPAGDCKWVYGDTDLGYPEVMMVNIARFDPADIFTFATPWLMEG